MPAIRALLLALAGMLFLVARVANAGYAYPSPPAGFAGSSSGWTFQASNASQWLVNGTVRTNAALNVAGRAVTVPATLRVAANAGTFAARFMFANPLVVTAAGVAWLASQYVTWDAAQGRWVYSDPNVSESFPSDGYEYRLRGFTYYYNSEVTTSWGPSMTSSSCSQFAQSYVSRHAGFELLGAATLSHLGGGNYQCSFTFRVCSTCLHMTGLGTSDRRGSSCPAGWYVTTAGCVQTPQPVSVNQTEEQFVERIAPLIQPAEIPQYIPPQQVPIPVELPEMTPFAVPTGEPRPFANPQYDPATNPSAPPLIWEQPWTRVVPSPSSDEPWRVDLQPEVRKSSDPSTLGAPEGSPNGSVSPTEWLSCGLPGTPACVIDEQGTPGQPEVDAMQIDKAADEWKEQMDELRDQVSGPDDKGFLEQFRSLFVTPPFAACEPFTLPDERGVIDPCPVVDGVRSFMAYVWAATGLFLCLGMMRQAFVKGS